VAVMKFERAKIAPGTLFAKRGMMVGAGKGPV
jgi:hypothetical protein